MYDRLVIIDNNDKINKKSKTILETNDTKFYFY